MMDTKAETTGNLLGLSNDATSDIEITAIDKTGKLDRKQLQIASNDTMETLIQKINSNTDVTVFFDTDLVKFHLQPKILGMLKDDRNNPQGIGLQGNFI